MTKQELTTEKVKTILKILYKLPNKKWPQIYIDKFEEELSDLVLSSFRDIIDLAKGSIQNIKLQIKEKIEENKMLKKEHFGKRY